MNPLLKILPKIEFYLESIKITMISDLEFFIKRESSNPKLRMFSFIYSFDDFKTVVYSIDNNGKTITDVVGLPIKNYKNLYAIENYDEFLPYDIEEEEEELYEKYFAVEKSLEFQNYREEYDELKQSIFTNWFSQCWKIACVNTKTNIIATLSIEDSSEYLNLSTDNYITDEEIRALFD
mgnify:CR=1 FL=1|jgi:hypothetical protein